MLSGLSGGLVWIFIRMASTKAIATVLVNAAMIWSTALSKAVEFK
jgi:hypothetical protein